MVQDGEWTSEVEDTVLWDAFADASDDPDSLLYGYPTMDHVGPGQYVVGPDPHELETTGLTGEERCTITITPGLP